VRPAVMERRDGKRLARKWMAVADLDAAEM
jgi:hypothetical protein